MNITRSNWSGMRKIQKTLRIQNWVVFFLILNNNKRDGMHFFLINFDANIHDIAMKYLNLGLFFFRPFFSLSFSLSLSFQRQTAIAFETTNNKILCIFHGRWRTCKIPATQMCLCQIKENKLTMIVSEWKRKVKEQQLNALSNGSYIYFFSFERKNQQYYYLSKMTCIPSNRQQNDVNGKMILNSCRVCFL